MTTGFLSGFSQISGPDRMMNDTGFALIGIRIIYNRIVQRKKNKKAEPFGFKLKKWTHFSRIYVKKLCE